MSNAKLSLAMAVAIMPLMLISGSASAESAHNAQTEAHNSDVWDTANTAWLKQQPGWESLNARVEQLGSTRSGTAQGIQQQASQPAEDAAPTSTALPATDDIKFLLNRR